MTEEERDLNDRAMQLAMNARTMDRDTLIQEAVVVATFAQRMLACRDAWKLNATTARAEEREACRVVLCAQSAWNPCCARFRDAVLEDLKR